MMRPARVLATILLVTGCGRVGFDLTGSTVGGEVGTGGRAAGSDAASGGTTADSGGSASSGGTPGSGGTSASTGGTSASTGGADAAAPVDAIAPADTGVTDATDAGYTCTPGALETCDGRDNDCNGLVDDGSPCPTQCAGHAWGGHGYMLCDNVARWDSSELLCVTQGMHLARIDSPEENAFATTLASTLRTGVWLGGSDTALLGDWRWIDGTAFWSGGPAASGGTAVGGAYTNWLSTEPDNIRAGGNTDATCLRMLTDGTWVDDGCNIFYSSLCESP